MIARCLSSIRRYILKQPCTSLEQALRAQRRTFAEWFAREAKRETFYVRSGLRHLPELRKRFPKLVEATIESADRLMRHEFNVLGSGPFVPVDTSRAAGPDYVPIDWCFDPIENASFPNDVPYKQWSLALRPGNADIKIPWEIARCQHWMPLAQAYLLTNEERYAREIIHQALDFSRANPVGVGIHWTCTMDVALRALNWALALDLVQSASSPTEQQWREIYESLFARGLFIFDNFENNYEVTSNHYLSNVVGLYYLAVLFRDLPIAERWRTYCEQALHEEINVQVLPDGADFESSVPYHRLVTELFLGAYRLADHSDGSFSDEYRATLTKMIEYLVAVNRPDGLMPQIGDADDGRLHVLTRYGGTPPGDGRHLFGVASRLFRRSDWRVSANDDSDWEAAWWGLDAESSDVPVRDQRPVSKLFPDAGVCTYRDDSVYLIITNGIVGTKGFGNHKHNDQLSFELHWNGDPFIVDPGSYVYTRDPESRNLFRGTSYHNTLMVDDAEQNEINPEWLFRTIAGAPPEHLQHKFIGDEFYYRGLHRGYLRLASPVVHERSFQFRKHDRVLSISDTVRGCGRHSLAWHFHCDPNVVVEQIGGTEFLLKSNQATLALSGPDGLRCTVNDGWCSSSYGVKHPCKTIDLRYEVSLDQECILEFTIRRTR